MVAIVIDDEVLVAEYTSRLLNRAGFTVHTFTDAFVALDNDEIKTADIFYLDIEMPEISGLKLAKRIQAVNNDCEVVFITGHNQYAIEAFDVNALDYLLKPLTQGQIERSIERIKKRRAAKESFHGAKETIKEHISVSLFGKISVCTGNGSKSIRFMTVKGAEVFCYMLLHKGTTEISKWKLIDDIWPDKDVRKGDINLRSTISRLNKTFRDNGMGIAMKSTRNGYQLDIYEEIEVDVFLLETIANTSYSISVDNLISYELTILSYNDTLFEDFDSEWCIIYRNLYQRYYKIAVIKLIDYYKKVQQDPLRILNIIERITQFEPYDDEIREVALNLYYNGYGRFEAMKYYSDYIKLLRKDLGLEPGKKLRGCYKTLMQEL